MDKQSGLYTGSNRQVLDHVIIKHRAKEEAWHKIADQQEEETDYRVCVCVGGGGGRGGRQRKVKE